MTTNGVQNIILEFEKTPIGLVKGVEWWLGMQIEHMHGNTVKSAVSKGRKIEINE